MSLVRHFWRLLHVSHQHIFSGKNNDDASNHWPDVNLEASKGTRKCSDDLNLAPGEPERCAPTSKETNSKVFTKIEA
jgi:hypothetical protein